MKDTQFAIIVVLLIFIAHDVVAMNLMQSYDRTYKGASTSAWVIVGVYIIVAIVLAWLSVWLTQ